jgi:hypothetical protein
METIESRPVLESELTVFVLFSGSGCGAVLQDADDEGVPFPASG